MKDTKEFKEAVTEVLDILKHMDEEYIKLIPLDFIKQLNENKSEEYIPNIDYTKPLEPDELKPDTKNIIAMIFLDYLCTNEEHEEYEAMFKENERKAQEELREKYNPDVFANRRKEKLESVEKVQTEDKTIEEKEEVSLVPVEEEKNFFKRLFKKIYYLFN